ncbi:MAG: beta-lactamase family protein [Thermomicrobiales bacterium]|nr:beta-lactamase family protein [Thermomicrobiales bacterium]
MTDFTPLNQWIQARIDRDGTPGVAIAITDRERTRYVGTFGFADLAAQTPVGEHHAFEDGSIGKTYTALLYMILRERGLVDLHAPVSRYLPWFVAGDGGRPITLHHLLTHSAGLMEGTDLSADGRFEAWSLRHHPLIAPPGERFSYSDIGFKILGYVLEEILGESYSSAVTREILEPLGMRDSFSPITDYERHRLAVGYRFRLRDRPWRREIGLVPDTWIETGTGDGSIAVTPGDMARFTRALLNRGNGLISEESFALMNSPLAPPDPDDPDTTYGYGLWGFENDGRRYYGHDGDMLGYYSALQIDPEAGLGVGALINGPGDVNEIANEALAFARGLFNGDPYALPEIAPLTVIESAADLAGDYHADGETWTFVDEEDRLYLALEDRRVPVERYLFDPRYILLDPEFDREMLIFERNDDGAVVALRHGDRWLARAGSEHAEPPAAPEHWRALTGWYQCHNPWQPRFRIFIRRGSLRIAWGRGIESELFELPGGSFRVDDVPSPDRISFDVIEQGQALRATLNGQAYYRTIWSSLPDTRR